MWEVFTCGKMPYGRMKNTEVVEKVQKGIISLERPKGCDKEIYDVSTIGSRTYSHDFIPFDLSPDNVQMLEPTSGRQTVIPSPERVTPDCFTKTVNRLTGQTSLRNGRAELPHRMDRPVPDAVLGDAH